MLARLLGMGLMFGVTPSDLEPGIESIVLNVGIKGCEKAVAVAVAAVAVRSSRSRSLRAWLTWSWCCR